LFTVVLAENQKNGRNGKEAASVRV